ncbi:MAG: hypothetical protein SNJ82_12215 [Gemmataceae bacterium]
MRLLVAGLLGLLVGSIVGCVAVSPAERATSSYAARASLFEGQEDAKTLFVDSAVIERPAEDEYCTETVWQSCDEQFVGLEQLAQFESNGWRVGRLAAPLPSRLQNLLNSKRNCSGPRRQRAQPDESLRVNLSDQPRKRIVELQGKQPRRLELANSLGQLEVTPRWTDDEQLVVRLMPVLTQNDSRPRPTVEETPEGALRLALDVRKPSEAFPELAFELTLKPGEYLLIGPRGEDRYSVGHALLTEEENGQFFSRWVLLRVVRPRTEEAFTAQGKAAPLALQAGYSTARGSSR